MYLDELKDIKADEYKKGEHTRGIDLMGKYCILCLSYLPLHVSLPSLTKIYRRFSTRVNVDRGRKDACGL
jgi:hypothetical protein